MISRSPSGAVSISRRVYVRNGSFAGTHHQTTSPACVACHVVVSADHCPQACTLRTAIGATANRPRVCPPEYAFTDNCTWTLLLIGMSDGQQPTLALLLPIGDMHT
jgi:hypothetical protein